MLLAIKNNYRTVAGFFIEAGIYVSGRSQSENTLCHFQIRILRWINLRGPREGVIIFPCYDALTKIRGSDIVIANGPFYCEVSIA